MLPLHHRHCFQQLSEPSSALASGLWGICSGMAWFNQAMQVGEQESHAQLKGYFGGRMKQQGCALLTHLVLIRNRTVICLGKKKINREKEEIKAWDLSQTSA